MTEISLTGDAMLSVLECVAAHGPISATQCARHCNLNRTVAHRLLTTLMRRLYVVKTTAGYLLGPAAVSIAAQAQPSIVSIAKPEMAHLAAGVRESVVLHGLIEDEAIVLDQALDLTHVVVVRHNQGSRHPLFRGASGWSLLAFQPGRLTDRVLAGLPETEREPARRRIEKVRTLGYAHSRDELQLGVHGLAAPVRGRDGFAQASIGILVPQSRATNLLGMSTPLLACARAIEARLSA
ncbi:MAG: helix-turn-helix domain-containing protein [Rhodobacteraceae bacterium]|jgi:DNA-binding IclR family transcriptional regulator|nr:helix-turn-helix domain-containing protein [Paracoccaceae bacterium]